MYKRQRLPGPPATVRSVGTGQAGEVELRRQTPILHKCFDSEIASRPVRVA